jgi:hypothetical protein
MSDETRRAEEGVHSYPFRDPCRRAETKCRWKTTKRMIIGARMSSDPPSARCSTLRP